MYLRPSIDAAGDPPSLRVRFELPRETLDALRMRPNVFFSYQVFDPANGLLLIDGARTPLPAVDPANQTTEITLTLELPPDPGDYRVIASPLEEDVCWLYERGTPFLLVDARVEDGRISVRRFREQTLGRLRLETLVRSMARAFKYPVRTIAKNRTLIQAMVRRDFVARYRGSLGGIFWTVLNPLLLMLTYFFVFGIVLRSRLGNDPSRSSFALYFLAGMLPWLPMSEALGRAPSVIREHASFVKKLVFPVEILPVNLVLAGMVTGVFALGIFLLGLLLARGNIPWTAALLPVLVIPQVLFTLGLAWFLGALGVYARDLSQINAYVLTLWFFLTPICYPVDSLPTLALPLFSKNPLFVLVEGYRALLLEGRIPSFGPLWKLWLLAAAFFLAGHAWFYKLRRSFPDVL